ncbi:MAG TPA: hypothetical protein EYP14_12615, partial [Planctomycetaceae bacterium]|nr:hypothetical protein [Planctomycetaceae bacterium]
MKRSALLVIALGIITLIGVTAIGQIEGPPGYVATDIQLISQQSKPDWSPRWTGPIEAATILAWFHGYGYPDFLSDLNGDGVIDELGVHGIWSPYHNLQAILTRHHIRPLFIPAQEENWVYRRGRRVYTAAVGSAIRHSWAPAPLHYLALFMRPYFLAMLGLRDWLTLPRVWYSLIFSLGIDPLREGQPLEGLWLSDFVRGWAPALRAFFVGLARNGLSAIGFFRVFELKPGLDEAVAELVVRGAFEARDG